MSVPLATVWLQWCPQSVEGIDERTERDRSRSFVEFVHGEPIRDPQPRSTPVRGSHRRMRGAARSARTHRWDGSVEREPLTAPRPDDLNVSSFIRLLQSSARPRGSNFSPYCFGSRDAKTSNAPVRRMSARSAAFTVPSPSPSPLPPLPPPTSSRPPSGRRTGPAATTSPSAPSPS